MDSEYFEKSWRVSCFGGFLFGREALKRMVSEGEVTIIYTSATAVLRGLLTLGHLIQLNLG